MGPVVGLKIDVDTERGTREGVPALVKTLQRRGLPACFLFSLGPDNTGKAIRRVLRPGFFQKVSRTSVVQLYGVQTLLNGTLSPAPHIGERHASILRGVRDAGFETGIHCHDHFEWQDFVRTMSMTEVRREFGRARGEYFRIFGEAARTAGAPGWQACANSRQAYDEAGLLYASDTRGTSPHFVSIEGRRFKTLELPSTLPTFDELLGRPEYPESGIPAHYASLLRTDLPNVFTIHAELEGMGKAPLFESVLDAMLAKGARFVRTEDIAKDLLRAPASIPTCELVQAEIDGRSGDLAVQGRVLSLT